MNEIPQETAMQNPGETGQAAGEPKLIPQEQVNAIVGKAKQQAAEKARRDTLAEMQQSYTQQSAMPQYQQAAPQQPPQASNIGQGQDPVRQAVQDEFAKQVQAFQMQAQKAQAERQAHQTIAELGQKFNEAKSRYSDFDNVVNMQHFAEIPQVLEYANTVDNSGDVVYDLLKNPGKISQLTGVPRNIAMMQVRRLSDSIKQNQMAENTPTTPEPLSQIKPSNIGLGNGSNKGSVSDLRNDPSYRG